MRLSPWVGVILLTLPLIILYPHRSYCVEENLPPGEHPTATITLKDRSKITGRMVDSDEEKFRLHTKQGYMTIYYSQIASLEVKYRGEPMVEVPAPLGPSPRNPLRAGLSSALFPGLGQFYNREWSKGTLFLGLEVIRITVTAFSQDSRIERNLLFLGVALRMISCFEAVKTARKPGHL